jgi:hypothetical protein
VTGKNSPSGVSKVRNPFQMPSVQTMVSRKSSITNAFVNSVIPVFPPTEEEIRSALSILGIDAADLRCAYCGEKASEWDHMRPLVVKRRPTGFVSEIANLVPSCGKCNQSKGNKDWRSWISSKARLSPASRGVPDLQQRIERLEQFGRWRQPRVMDFESILGKELWTEYWESCEQMIAALKKSQELADRLKAIVVKSCSDSRDSRGK